MDVNGSFTMESVNAANIWSLADTFLMVYASLLLIIGIPGNIICGIIMGGNKANRLTTRILMVILSIADTGVLLTAVLRYWSIKIFDWDLRNDGPISCKLHVFSVAFSTDFAVGSLCAIAVERLLVVAFPHRANNVVTVTSVVLGMTSFGVLIAVKNLIHFWMMGMHSTAPTGENQTTIDIPGVEEENTYPLRCLSGPSYRTLFRLFMKIDFVSFAVLPSHSNLPDRVHIVAPKPCAPTNGESANNFPQINVTTVPHDEGI
ncbi:unnamed protein product [Echinostoma caproni]|uniref:G_PROTEIN_RECEP_F1_2 domain-containing protein n=1 Tax=Echinostoma caproni TaxID=27848 RepID=A0A183AB79_9TREM|nr:unnamed protein product [Echinostoma caproni]